APAPLSEQPNLQPAPAAMAGFIQSVQPEECVPVWGGSPAMFVEEPTPCEVLQVDLGALALAIEEAETSLSAANAVAIPVSMANARTQDAATPIVPATLGVLLIDSQLTP